MSCTFPFSSFSVYVGNLKYSHIITSGSLLREHKITSSGTQLDVRKLTLKNPESFISKNSQCTIATTVIKNA